MKQLTSGLLIGALASGLLTYTLVKPTDSASADSASAQPSLFQKEQSKSAGQQRSSSSAHSPQSGRSSTQNKAIGSVAHLQDLKTTRDQLQAANDIFSLSLDEVQALLRSPEIAGTNYFDQSGMTLISAAFARLTELSPEEAQKSLREFKSPLKQMGAMALYKEWAIQDPGAAMAAASEESEPNVKNMALAAVLGELANTEPQRAFDLAKENNNQQAYYAIISNWAKTDPAAAFEKAKTVGPQGQWLGQSILAIWATKDPDAAIDYANGLQKASDRASAFSGIIGATAQSDPDKAFEMIGKYNDIIEDDQLHSVVHQLSQQDPQRTLDWLNSRPSSQHKSLLLGTVIQQWMAKDETAALAYYNEISDKSIQSKVGESLLQQLSYRDPKKFLKLYSSINLKSNQSEWALTRALTELSKSDSAAAREFVAGLTNKTDRKNAIKGLMSGLAQDDPDEAIAVAELFTDPVERDAALGKVYDQMADKDPAAVAELFLSQGITKIGDYSLADVVSDFSRKDLSGAKDFVEKIDDPIIRDQVISRLLSQWSNEDPVAAFEYAQQQPVTDGIGNSMSSIGRKLAETNPQEGLQLALSTSNKSHRDKLLSSFFNEWGSNDLSAAIEALPLLSKDNPKENHHAIYSNLGRQFGDQPNEAAQWLATISNKKDQYSATRTFVGEWAKNQPNEAAAWTKDIQDNYQRDAAMRSLVNTFDNTEPAYAIEWASAITNNKDRISDVTRTYNSWKKRDPAAAQQWLQSTDLIGKPLKTKLSK